MKNKVFYLVALAVGMVFVLGGCKDCDDPSDPDCGNYDPCFGKYPDKLEIEMYCSDIFVEPFRSFDYHITKDSVFTSPMDFKFKTNHNYDSVKWYFSSSSQSWTTNELELRFSSNEPWDPLVGSFKIFCVGYRQKDPLCKGENDSGFDTISRNFRMVEWWNPKIIGYYRGLNDGETDSVDFYIDFDSMYHHGLNIYTYPGENLLANGLLPKAYENEPSYNLKFGVLFDYTRFKMNRMPLAWKPIFKNVQGYLINDDEILVEWVTNASYGYDGKKRIFKGKRIKK
jgi:hypothetical protein